MLYYGSELLKRTVTESFWNSYWEIPDPFDNLYWTRPSDQQTETYARLGAAPMPTQWSGDRDAKTGPELSFSSKNLPYDASILVDKELVKFDQIDAVADLASNLGTKARALRPSLASTLFSNGSATVGDDGQFFFDTDHADPGAEYTTSQDNDLTSAAASGTNPTDLEFATAIRSCFNAFWGFKDSRGDPAVPSRVMDPENFIVLVPPTYLSVALQVQNAESLTGPIGNDLRGRYTTRVNPFWTDTNLFYMCYAGSTHKPIINQEVGGGVEFTDSIDPHSGHIMYSATWWGRVNYGQWRTAILYTFT